MSSLRISRIERAADVHPGTTGMPDAIRRKAPQASHPRAYYSWTMHLVMWALVDPRRARRDKTCAPQPPKKSNGPSARTRWQGEARP
jgi:hypothetical protein